MKKIFSNLFLGVIVACLGLPVLAETMQVMALSDFNTGNPVEFIEVQAFNDVWLAPGADIKSGYTLKFKVLDIKDPQRLKRNAKFNVTPISYTDLNNKEHNIQEGIVGKYSPQFKIDPVDVAKNAALTVGDHFVKGISLGYHAVEGVVKNEEGNRFKSGAVSVYENSPFSYANKGEEVDIKKYDFFSFKFKLKDELDDDDDD